MSPLIRRKITQEIPTLHTKTSSEATFYVRPRDVEAGDVVVQPEAMRAEVLRDLAKTHPKEYAKDAASLQVLDVDEDELDPAIDEDDDNEDGDEDEFTPEQAEFLALNAEAAIASIEALPEEDVDTLALWFEAEVSRPKARKTVLEAFAAKGMS